MADQKPLPALPSGPNLPNLIALSVEARHHRRQLIRHFLNDLNDPAIDSRQDKWLSVFEDVLDDLGQYMSSGDWLDGIGNGRALKKKLAAAYGEGYTKTTRKDSLEDEGGDSKEPIHSSDEPKPTLSPFEQLRVLSSRSTPSTKPTSTHLVLCLTSDAFQITQDSGFKPVSADIGCTFTVGTFALYQPKEEEDGIETILLGLDGLESRYLKTSPSVFLTYIRYAVDVIDSPLTLVGGTFTLRGVNSPPQHNLLSKVLKLGVYIHLSLILEQHILFDSGVHLSFSRANLPFRSASSPLKTSLESPLKDKESHLGAGNFLPSRLSNIFARRSLHYHGGETITTIGTESSLDLTLPSGGVEGTYFSRVSEAPQEGHFAGRWHRLSFIREKRYTILRSLHHRGLQGRLSAPSQPFNNALKRLEKWKGLLSTSPGVIFSPPRIIADLSEREQAQSVAGQKHSRKLHGDERAALHSLLGWNRKEDEGRGMSGILGFLRQQEISVLYSLQVDPDSRTTRSNTSSSISSASTEAEIEKYPTTSQSSTSSKSEASRKMRESEFLHCDKPHWVTYGYYSTNSREDYTLSDWILDTTKRRNNLCKTRKGCTFTLGKHDIRIIHDGIRIIVKVTDEINNKSENIEEASEKERAVHIPNLRTGIEVWEHCAVCNAKTSRKKMSAGSR